jgi:SAM-dependent methyltransferase
MTREPELREPKSAGLDLRRLEFRELQPGKLQPGKLQRGELQLEDVPCPLCGDARREPAIRARDHNFGVPGVFTVVRCGQCGFHYMCPRPTDATLAFAYPEVYAWGYQSGRDPAHLRAFEERLRILRSVQAQGRLLEVGCSAGHFLDITRKAGYEVAGVEPDERTAAFAREHYGLDVRNGTLEHAGLSGAGFDIICMFDVLEHIATPRECLAAARACLKPAGRLVLKVPNFSCLERRLWRQYWYGIDLPRHLLHFTPETLARMLESAGFDRIRILHTGEPNYGVQSFFRWARHRLGRKSGSAEATALQDLAPVLRHRGIKNGIAGTLSAANRLPARLLARTGQGNSLVAIAGCS